MYLSSELYLIEPQDITALPDSTAPFAQEKLKDEIVVLIGNSSKGETDKLVKGRERIASAIAKGEEHIEVRFAFKPNMPLLLRPFCVIKQIRKRYHYTSSNIYHTTASRLRAMGIERAVRTIDNAYQFSNPKWRRTEQERKNRYMELAESMTANGYSDEQPMGIMLCRSFGVLDSLDQGHHRMAICLDCGIERVAFELFAAAKAPLPLALLMVPLARLKKLTSRLKRS